LLNYKIKVEIEPLQFTADGSLNRRPVRPVELSLLRYLGNEPQGYIFGSEDRRYQFEILW